MPNLLSNSGEGSHAAPLAVMFPTHGENVDAIVEDVDFSSVEDILPRNPEARSNLH